MFDCNWLVGEGSCFATMHVPYEKTPSARLHQVLFPQRHRAYIDGLRLSQRPAPLRQCRFEAFSLLPPILSEISAYQTIKGFEPAENN